MSERPSAAPAAEQSASVLIETAPLPSQAAPALKVVYSGLVSGGASVVVTSVVVGGAVVGSSVAAASPAGQDLTWLPQVALRSARSASGHSARTVASLHSESALPAQRPAPAASSSGSSIRVFMR